MNLAIDNREIEIRFLEVDKPVLIKKLLQLGAEDLGEELLQEIIFYDTANTWQQAQKMIRLRKNSRGIFLTYKHNQAETVDGTHEIELTVSDMQKAKDFLEALGFLYAKRVQEKKRHTLKLEGVVIDFDTWPRVPTYVELEGPSEQHLRDLTNQLGLDWNKGEFASARAVIERHYNIPVTDLAVYTFEEVQ